MEDTTSLSLLYTNPGDDGAQELLDSHVLALERIRNETSNTLYMPLHT